MRGKVSTAPGGGGESITGGDHSKASRTVCKERLRLLMQFSSFYFPSFTIRLQTNASKSPWGLAHTPAAVPALVSLASGHPSVTGGVAV